MSPAEQVDLPVLVRLSEEDVASVARLYVRCADYFMLQDGVEADHSDAADLFQDVPPDKKADDLAVFGLLGDQQLDAVAALLRDYPSVGVWYLPFIVVDPDRRGQGLGSAFYAALEKWAVERGAREVRLVVLEVNSNGERFWHSLGFNEIRRVGPHTFKQKSHRRIEFKRYTRQEPAERR